MENITNIARVDNIISYRPIPFFQDTELAIPAITKKLDLNLFCIKRPHQTCFIQITNANMLNWGIEIGDIIVVEKTNEFSINDLIVISIDNHFQIYELIANSEGELIFLPADSNQKILKTKNVQDLTIVGVITNHIHQMKPKRKKIEFLA